MTAAHKKQQLINELLHTRTPPFDIIYVNYNYLTYATVINVKKNEDNNCIELDSMCDGKRRTLYINDTVLANLDIMPVIFCDTAGLTDPIVRDNFCKAYFFTTIFCQYAAANYDVYSSGITPLPKPVVAKQYYDTQLFKELFAVYMAKCDFSCIHSNKYAQILFNQAMSTKLFSDTYPAMYKALVKHDDTISQSLLCQGAKFLDDFSELNRERTMLTINIMTKNLAKYILSSDIVAKILSQHVFTFEY
jgi:hypothetical protein